MGRTGKTHWVEPLTQEGSVVIQLSNSQISGEAVFNSGNFQTLILVQKYLGLASTLCTVSPQDQFKDGGQEGTIASRLHGSCCTGDLWSLCTTRPLSLFPHQPLPVCCCWKDALLHPSSPTQPQPLLPQSRPSQVSRHSPQLSFLPHRLSGKAQMHLGKQVLVVLLAHISHEHGWH